jgi:integrase
MGSMMAKLDLPYVHRTVDRHGKVYFHFRKVGCPRVRLKGEIGSTEFMAAYSKSMGDVSALSNSLNGKMKLGSVAALVNLWYQSGEFRQLRPSTQTTYRGIMGRFLIDHGDKPAALMGKKHVSKIIGDKAATPAAANNLMARLKQISRFAIENDWLAIDPTQGVRKIKYKVTGFVTWTEAEAEKFVAFHPAGSKPHLAFMILSHTGVRRSDLVRLGRGNIRGDSISITQLKNSEPVIIPMTAALSETLATVKDRMIFMQTEYGKPFTAAGFGGWFRGQCNKAGLPECSAHGLRKLIATRLAEAGCNENTISAILGWANNKQASLYTKAANKEKMARAGMKAIA